MMEIFIRNVPSNGRRSVALRYSFLVASTFLTLSAVPMASAQIAAPHIVVDPSAGAHPTLSVTGNGADQVNIVGPNAAGLSHNRFTEYNVGQNGLVLNNATTATQTQIGGKIAANGNLNGTAAKVILNEVTGGNASVLAGTTEVAGQQAAIVVANPNGISCSGCGFVNTSRATLTTGKPTIDDNGALKSLEVADGNVTFEGKGGDFTSVPVLDIVSRTVTVKDSAQVKAQKLNIVAGRNTVNYADVTQTKQMQPDPDKKNPEFAVDTSAMGGLYADKIYMVVNEDGAGVRVNGDMAANTGDVEVSASGDIVNTGHIVAKQGRVQLSAAGDFSNNSGTITAAKDVSVSTSGDLSNSGTIESQQGQAHFSASGDIINNAGSITAQRGLEMTASGDIVNSGKITNANGNTYASNSGAITNKTGAEFSNANGSLYLSATGALNNSGTISNKNNSALSKTAGSTTLKSTNNLKNSGKIVLANSDLSAESLSKLSNDGSIEGVGSKVDLTSTNNAIQNTGSVTGDQGVTLQAASSISNKGGTIKSSTSSIALGTGTWSDVDNTNGTISAEKADVSFSTRKITNTNGSVTAGNSIKGSANSYVSNAGSVFTAGKTMDIAFAGKVQKLGQYGVAGDTGTASSGGAASGGSTTTPAQKPSVGGFPSWMNDFFGGSFW